MLCTSGAVRRISASDAATAWAGSWVRVAIGLKILLRFSGCPHQPRLARQLLDPLVDRARVVHRAELRATHRAALGALEVLGGERLVVVFARTFGVEAETELLVPIERVTRAAQRIVPVARARTAPGDVRGMGG